MASRHVEELPDEKASLFEIAEEDSGTEGSRNGGCCKRYKTASCKKYARDMLSELKNSSIARYGREFFTVKNAKRKFPIVNWLPKYRLKHFVGDLVAGLTVGLTVIPQGLAYAVVAELPPQYGLYSAFMGCFLYTFLGTSKDITLGPTAIMSSLIAEYSAEKMHKFGVEDDPTYAILLTLITGLIQVVMGLLNMGFIVQFISFPVISGFTSAAAIKIAFGQVRKWLGLKGIPRAFLPQVEKTFQNLYQTNLWDMSLGLTCMIVLTLMKYLKDAADKRMKASKGPKKALLKFIWITCTARNAVVVIVCAVITYFLNDVYNIQELTLTGNVKPGMPIPRVPDFTLEAVNHATNETIYRSTSQIFSDIGEGFAVVTLIGMLESIAIAKAFARRNEYRIDPSQELIAVGLANALSSFFHSYPVTGSFSRTAINSQSGVRTPAAGIWTGGLVILAIVFLTAFFKYIPQAALAGVIITAVLQMVDYEILATLWRVKKLDLLPLLITFFVCMFVNYEFGILAGVGFSFVMLLYPMARPTLKINNENIADDKELGDDYMGSKSGVILLEPRQGLTFPGTEYIKDKVMKHGVYEEPPHAIVLNASHFSLCDYTMVLGITQLSDYFNKHNLQFVIADCPEDIKDTLTNAKIKDLKFFDSVDEAIQHVSETARGRDVNSNGAANLGFETSVDVDKLQISDATGKLN